MVVRLHPNPDAFLAPAGHSKSPQQKIYVTPPLLPQCGKRVILVGLCFFVKKLTRRLCLRRENFLVQPPDDQSESKRGVSSRANCA